MKVIYPVLFYEEKEGGYSVFVPDLEEALNCSASTCGSTLQEAMEMAEDLIAGLIIDEMEEDHKIPKPSKIEDVSFKKFEDKINIENWDYVSKFKTYIAVDISAYAEKWGKELVKKTVNIPKWINVKAESLKINFSKTLEEALLDKIYNK
jgi:predicted RNase H-like HicB family nuclease